MKTVIAKLRSITPYSQSRYHGTEKLDREIPRDWEARTWRERCHVDENGQLSLPPTKKAEAILWCYEASLPEETVNTNEVRKVLSIM